MPSDAEVHHVRRLLLRWWKHNGREFWWRESRDPFTVALVEVLLKQTRASSSAAAIRAFVECYPTPAALAAAPESELLDELRPFGFQRQRASHLAQLAKQLQAEPDALSARNQELRQLPGIGAYAAAAIGVFAHGRRETVIDVNVVRVFRRLWGLSVPRGELRKSALIREVGEMYAGTTKPREANWALLDLGAEICKERQPRCPICPLLSSCQFGQRLAATSKLARKR